MNEEEDETMRSDRHSVQIGKRMLPVIRVRVQPVTMRPIPLPKHSIAQYLRRKDSRREQRKKRILRLRPRTTV